MSSLKNKSIIKAIFLTSMFASFGAQATPVPQDIVINNAQTSPVSFNDGDSLTINSDASLQTSSDPAILLDDVAGKYIINRGTISSPGESISVTNASSLGVIDNLGYIKGAITVSDGSHLGAINNGGTITNGIEVTSDSSIGSVNNSGLIEGAPGDFVIAFDSGNNVLNLNAGSHIVGRIRFLGENDTINIGYGPQASAIYSFRDEGSEGDATPTINAAAGLVVLTTVTPDEGAQEGVIEVVDPSSFATAQDTTLKSSVDIGNLIADRLTQARLEDSTTNVASNEDGSFVQVAALNNRNSRSDASNSGIAFNKFNENQPYYWSEVFGSYNERSSYKNQGRSESSNGGLIFGADKKIACNERLGGFVGALSGSSDINISGNVVATKVDSKGLFGGAYLSQNHKGYFTDFSLIAGVLDNDSNRLVYELSGNQIASTEYTSVFITPSATIGKNLNTPVIPTIISATLRYTGQWVDSYVETGTDNSNIASDSRYLNTVSTRLKIETNNKSRKVANGNFKFNVRTGLEANHVIGSQNVDITVIGQNISVDTNNRDYNIDGFVGFNTAYDLQDNVQLYADVEGTKGLNKHISNDNLGLYGKLGLKWGF